MSLRFCGRIDYKRLSFGILVFWGMCWVCPSFSFAQSDTLHITFDSVSIADTTVYRGVSAGFPHPVLSLITVKDEDNRYVHGLADKTRWLTPQDTNEMGVLVDDVWKTIWEYHEEDTTQPADPDVKQTTPEFLVTELTNVGISVALVMDYSWSMLSDSTVIQAAEEAARTFVRQMAVTDRAAIIKFRRHVEVFQDFTSDTTLLMEAIDRKFYGDSGTSYFDGIYEGIRITIPEAGRRTVVLYTDGRDNSSSHKKFAVIAYAQKNEIPVYTIGIGNQIIERNLKSIAYDTGGDYFKAEVEDLADVYLSIYGDMAGYYVLAHTSPDPCFDGTWRLVDLTLQYGEAEGRGVGRYRVPFLAPNVRVSKQVNTDSVRVVDGDTLHYALAGDTVSYGLWVMNDGLGRALDVEVVDSLPDSLSLIDYDRIPAVVTDDSLVWQIPRMDAGESVRIGYRVGVRSRMPMDAVELVNTVGVQCPGDSIPTDNEDQDTLYALGLPDFGVRCIPRSGTASPGYPLSLSAEIWNQGSADATRAFQTSFFVEGLVGEVVTVDTDTISSLAVGDTLRIQGTWQSPGWGDHTVRAVVDAEEVIDESDETNNEDACSVVVGINSLSVRVSDVSLSDEIRGVQGGFPESVLTSVNVTDQNSLSVRQLADQTAWLRPSDTSESGALVGNIWQQVSEYHREQPSYPANPDVTSTFSVTALTDVGFSVVLALDVSADLEGWHTRIDEGLSGFVEGFGASDWGAVLRYGGTVEVIQPFTQNKTLIASALDNSYSGSQRRFYDGLYEGISRASSRTGRNAVLAVVGGEDVGSSRDVSDVVNLAQDKGVPVYVLGLGGSIQGAGLEELCEETGGWYVGQTDVSDLSEPLSLIEGFLRDYYVFFYTSPDTIQNETWRVVDVTLSAFDLTRRDTGVYRSPLGFADVGVEKRAVGDSVHVVGQDTNWFVHSVDSVRYTLAVRNVGHQDVEDIVVEDVLPVCLNPVVFERNPTSILGNTLVWSFDSLGVGEEVRFDYVCAVDSVFLDTLTVAKTLVLANAVSLDCPQDTLLFNNADSDTVYLVLLPIDISVTKTGIGDSLSVSGQDTTWYVLPGDTVAYTVLVANRGDLTGENITVQEILPEEVTLIGASDPPVWQSGDTLVWSVDRLAGRGTERFFTYTCRVDTFMPPWEVPLVNRVTVDCEGDGVPGNDADGDTVWVAGIVPPDPQVRVTPSVVTPGDSVRVEVMTPVSVQGWDLRLFFEDGSWVTTYADAFIQSTVLQPYAWTVVVPDFGDTWMRTDEQEERVGVVFETVGFWGETRSATAYITLRSSDEFFLDENVFRTSTKSVLDMRFKLSSNRRAKVVVYDISGAFVKKVEEGNFVAGWSFTSWDGKSESGSPVGSGVYVAVLMSGSFQKAHKFILVR